MKGENIMTKAHKGTNQAYRDHYDENFRNKKEKKTEKKSSKDRITKKEINEIKKEFLQHTVIGSDPPRPVKISTLSAQSVIRSRRCHQEWLDSVHDSHDMTDWYGEIKSPVGTARFYSVRKCKNCEYEQYEHPAGKFIDGPLTLECEGI